MARVHPTAVVDARTVLADDVEIGPFVVIEGQIELGAGCIVGPFCHFEGSVKVGEGNRFISHCSIGAPPQDLKYKGDPTRVEIGRQRLQEYVTVHRAPGAAG
jgi:UDP-N-acetylglucosamine acyltransferase